jgi:hypothetical protein
MSGVHAVSSAPRVSTSATRCGRGAKRRKPARPPRPQTPVDFFSSETYALRVDLLASRAQRWLADRLPPLYFYPRDSVPLWGDYAQHRCSGTTLRAVGRRLLCESLCVDLDSTGQDGGRT